MNKEYLIVLKPSLIDKGGIGVFAATDIKKGVKVAEGIHQDDYKNIIPWPRLKQYSKNIQKMVHNFCIGTHEGFIPPEEMDFNKLSVEWYFNHSCSGNLGFNNNGDFIAIKNIKKGKELSYDYGLAESNPEFKMKCNCGNKNCRKIITGNDWKNKEFRRYMLPELRRQHETIHKIPAY
jgi:hypothetical protein